MVREMGRKTCARHLIRILVASMMLLVVINARAQTVERAYCGEDGKAHVTYADHSSKTIPPEAQQIGCTDIAIADDHRTFAWSMQVENCCTSYPISVAVIAMRDGKTTVLRSDQMVWQWHFMDNGNRIAILSGPVHGTATEADLYDVPTGKKLATWEGSGGVPEWAGGWEDQFGSDENQ
jgi:hypothetical protein